jgi:hypothetical protein
VQRGIHQGQQHELAVQPGQRARPSSRLAASQNAGTARWMSACARRSTTAFQRITTQAETDISSSRAATATADAVGLVRGRRRGRLTYRPSTSSMPYRPRSWLRQEARRAQAALGIGGAAAALVGDLDALAGAGEQHGVVTDDVAAADGGEADARRVALAGDAFARVDRAVLQVAAERLGQHLAHLQRGAAGRVDLVAVVGLDDLDVVALVASAARPCPAAQHDVDAHAHVGRQHDGDVLAAAAISAFWASLKPVVPMTARTPCRRQAARCASVPSGRVKSISTSARARPACRSAVIATPVVLAEKAPASWPSAGLPATSSAPAAHVVGAQHGLDQHVAHAAGGAGDGDAQGAGAHRPRAAGSCVPGRPARVVAGAWHRAPAARQRLALLLGQFQLRGAVGPCGGG